MAEIAVLFPISVVTVVNKEQLAGTRALISCTVTGLTRKLDSVKWRTSNKVAISSGENGYIVYDGEFDSTADGSQTTILTVPDSLNNRDTTYNCLITSDSIDQINKTTVVVLKTFSKFYISYKWIGMCVNIV